MDGILLFFYSFLSFSTCLENKSFLSDFHTFIVSLLNCHLFTFSSVIPIIQKTNKIPLKSYYIQKNILLFHPFSSCSLLLNNSNFPLLISSLPPNPSQIRITNINQPHLLKPLLKRLWNLINLLGLLKILHVLVAPVPEHQVHSVIEKPGLGVLLGKRGLGSGTAAEGFGL